jgi:hypothetical protein
MLNATTFASTLCVLSEPLGLGVLDDVILITETLLKSSVIDVAATHQWSLVMAEAGVGSLAPLELKPLYEIWGVHSTRCLTGH